MSLNAALEYAQANRETHLNQYKDLLAIPSVSTLSEHQPDMQRCAEWLADQLRSLKMSNVEIMPTAGHPVVYAESNASPDKPTVLVYGHYDVQPADPFDEWDTPPFDPSIRGDNIYARGASDMKGQIFAQIKAVEALVQAGPLPFSIKYLLEGEEEIGSPNLGPFIDEHSELLRADFVLNCDAGIHAPDVPAIVYALRGLAYYELEVRGPRTDLHSGFFGGTIHNPLQALCELIAGMHDSDGRVTLPGFYDSVRTLTSEEREAIAQLPHSDDDWLALTGAPALLGETGYTTIERIGARPTLEVNGIWGGFTGEGSKTVLPAVATAKISMRLVADQDESQIRSQLEAYLNEHAPKTITWTLCELVHGPSAIMDRHSPYMNAAVSALKTMFGKDPIFKREGGSVPIVGMMKEKLDIDSVMLGFALPTDGIHGPNEKQYLPNFYKGIDTYIHFLTLLTGG